VLRLGSHKLSGYRSSDATEHTSGTESSEHYWNGATQR